jgi:hypothetical protein
MPLDLLATAYVPHPAFHYGEEMYRRDHEYVGPRKAFHEARSHSSLFVLALLRNDASNVFFSVIIVDTLFN